MLPSVIYLYTILYSYGYLANCNLSFADNFLLYFQTGHEVESFILSVLSLFLSCEKEYSTDVYFSERLFTRIDNCLEAPMLTIDTWMLDFLL